MAKIQIALASALSLALLASCGGPVAAGAENGANAADTEAPGNAAPSDPLQAPPPAGNEAEAVPPPDAVSHPDGYLPLPVNGSEPAGPAEADPPGAGTPSPATEDEYIRNRQAEG